MVDMISFYQESIRSIDEDIEKLTSALAIIDDVRLKLTNNDNLEHMIKLLGGEIAWLQSKRKEAQEHLSSY